MKRLISALAGLALFASPALGENVASTCYSKFSGAGQVPNYALKLCGANINDIKEEGIIRIMKENPATKKFLDLSNQFRDHTGIHLDFLNRYVEWRFVNEPVEINIHLEDGKHVYWAGLRFGF